MPTLRTVSRTSRAFSYRQTQPMRMREAGLPTIRTQTSRRRMPRSKAGTSPLLSTSLTRVEAQDRDDSLRVDVGARLRKQHGRKLALLPHRKPVLVPWARRISGLPAGIRCPGSNLGTELDDHAPARSFLSGSA